MSPTHTIEQRRSEVPRRIDAALALLRLVVGSVFVAHGAQKLFGLGLPAITGGLEQMGVPYAHVAAPLVAILEFFGGIALVLGLLTRVVALGLTINMVTALVLVHLPNGFFLPNGIEFVLTLAAASVALMFAGAGAYSIDALMRQRRHVTHTAPPPEYVPRPT
ncbi:MAG: DoxX family protein [Gemmatimonadaceae bacterium]